jgi:hypothetical protein
MVTIGVAPRRLDVHGAEGVAEAAAEERSGLQRLSEVGKVSSIRRRPRFSGAGAGAGGAGGSALYVQTVEGDDNEGGGEGVAAFAAELEEADDGEGRHSDSSCETDDRTFMSGTSVSPLATRQRSGKKEAGDTPGSLARESAEDGRSWGNEAVAEARGAERRAGHIHTFPFQRFLRALTTTSTRLI